MSKMRLFWGIAALSMLMAPAMAAETGRSCAALVDDGERLACYDAVFRTPDIAGLSELVVSSEQLIPARPSGREPATMRIACIETGMDVQFAFAGQSMSASGDIAPVTLQVDQGGSQVRALAAIPGNTALRFATPRDADAFLDSLVGGSTLKIRATPVRQRSVNVTFALPPVLEAVTALRESCAQPR